jgi:HEPN domain-containing protein
VAAGGAADATADWLVRRPTPVGATAAGWYHAGSRGANNAGPTARDVAVKRLRWQQLAERWLVDAEALFDAHRWDAAYYLAGYAVEFGLKSCVLKRLAAEAEVIFEEKRFSERCWTHSIEELVKLAGLEEARKVDSTANPTLGRNWVIVKDWSENARYQTVSHQKAKKLFNAINDKAIGVMQWIKAHW